MINRHPAVAAAAAQSQRKQKRPLLTHQAAAILECDPRTVRRLCEQQLIRATKKGRRKWQISPDAIEEYIENLNHD